jgi:magnesium-transporting ATPase (P-type)
VQPITEEIRNSMNQAIHKMAENSLRTICMAYKKLGAKDDIEAKDEKGVFNI